jgi:hypothetical protein
MSTQKNMKKKSKMQSKGAGPKVSVPVAATRSQTTTRAKITNKSDGSVRVVHRELVGNLVGQVAFTLGTVTVNPGLSGTFPWLSGIAQSFEEYKFNKLRFCYYPRCSTATAGSVMLIPEYDVTEDPPVTEQIAASYVGTREDAPWKAQVVDLPASALQGTAKRHFVRPLTGLINPNEDPKLYDVALFYTGAVDASGANQPWGKLWVEYDVDLYLPQLSPYGPLPYGGKVTGNTSITKTNPLGSSPVLDPESRGFIVTGASDVLMKIPGDYILSIVVTGTTLVAPLYSFNASDMAVIYDDTVVNTTGNVAFTITVLRVLNSNAEFEITYPAAGSVSSTSMYVSSVPFNGAI